MVSKIYFYNKNDKTFFQFQTNGRHKWRCCRRFRFWAQQHGRTHWTILKQLNSFQGDITEMFLFLTFLLLELWQQFV